MKKEDKDSIFMMLCAAIVATHIGAWADVLNFSQFLTLFLAEITILVTVMKEK